MTTVLTPNVEKAPKLKPNAGTGARVWAWIWPKALAILLVLAVWQLVYWSGWRPAYVFPSPATTLAELGQMVQTERFWSAMGTTVVRAITGFALALVIGTTIGILVARRCGDLLRRESNPAVDDFHSGVACRDSNLFGAT